MPASTGRSRSSSAQNPWIVVTRASSSFRSAASRCAASAALASLRACSTACRSRSFSSPAAFSVNVTAATCGDPRAPGRDHADDPRDELRRLARAGGGLDDERLVERVLRDQRAIAGVSEWSSWPASSRSSRSPSSSRALRFERRSSSGPQTRRKSQYAHAFSAGAAGNTPSSTARSTISSTSMPVRRSRSVIGTDVLGEAAGGRAVPVARRLRLRAPSRLRPPGCRSPAAASSRRRGSTVRGERLRPVL